MHAAWSTISPRPESPNATYLQFFGSRLANKEGKERGIPSTRHLDTLVAGLASG